MTPSDAKADLETRLGRLGFDFKQPDLGLAWTAFREHLGQQVEGARDYVMVEVGTYDFSFQPIRPAFTVDLCRQFGFHDQNGNFQGYEQLHLMLYNPTSPEFEGVHGSFFADDGEARSSLFEAVEGSLAFLGMGSSVWSSARLMQWEV